MQLTQSDLQILCDIALQAGQEILSVYETGGETWQKDDNSPLTEADLRADAVIRKELEKYFPDFFIWSEESRSAAGLESDPFFLVDPLDGTKEFLKRNGEFTVNIALIHKGKAAAGVVYSPVLGELFYASTEQGAWFKNREGQLTSLHLNPVVQGNSLRVIGSRNHGTEALDKWLDTLNTAHELVSVGSSLKFCRVAQGLADVYPRFGLTSQWDTAAGQCILECAGGLVMNMQGESLLYGLERPILNTDFIAVQSKVLARSIGATVATL